MTADKKPRMTPEQVDALACALEDAHAKVDRLRLWILERDQPMHVLDTATGAICVVERTRLPVINVCGDCAHAGRAGASDRATCDYPPLGGHGGVDVTEPPPAWCPLRGGP